MPDNRFGTEPVLSVRGLRKVFGSQVAVDDVSFDVLPGRSLAIVGESGSGKTTVARMIVGLERPTAGPSGPAVAIARRGRATAASARPGAVRSRSSSRTPTPVSTRASAAPTDR